MHFKYLTPNTIPQAMALLARHKTRATVMAGGTDLVVKMRSRAIDPAYVVDLSNIPGLDFIDFNPRDGLNIGALASIRALETSTLVGKQYPVLQSAAHQLASPAIRNMATLGGNLCNASPSADMAPGLIALAAKARIAGPEGETFMPLEEFFSGPGKTALKAGQVLVGIQVPASQASMQAVYLKHARSSIELAVVGVAAGVILDSDGRSCKDVRIVLGAVAPTPMRARKAEAALLGKKLDDKAIVEAAEIAAGEARPISDVRASADYRTEMVRVFTGRALRVAAGIAS
ncbi:MAG: xanthine dehydrogenase family protein subunit M [Chloroflexi bacterium]|nr:xanthine dehydrogenase family protein subunit M [Chloroflexota bacterium]